MHTLYCKEKYTSKAKKKKVKNISAYDPTVNVQKPKEEAIMTVCVVK